MLKTRFNATNGGWGRRATVKQDTNMERERERVSLFSPSFRVVCISCESLLPSSSGFAVGFSVLYGAELVGGCIVGQGKLCAVNFLLHARVASSSTVGTTFTLFPLFFFNKRKILDM